MVYKTKRIKSHWLYNLFHYKTWKIQSQILCFAILLLSLITTLVYLSSFLLLNYTIKTLKTLSEQSLSTENRRQIQRFTQLQAFSSQEYFNQHSYQLHIINDLFLFNQEHNVQTIEPPPCLNETAITDKYALSSCFCYSYFGNGVIENAYSDSQMKILSAILAEYILEFVLRGPLYYATISSDEFFAIYNISVKPSFKPSQRQWYIDHLAQMKSGQEIIMSDPYFSALNAVHVAFSHNLSSLSGELFGIIADDSDFEVMPQFNDNNIKVSMVDYKDQLIISRLYQFDVSTIFQIYDQELTGISKSQWENMKSEADENGNFLTTDDVNDQEYLVSIFKIENPQIYIVLEIDNNIYRDSYLKLVNKYEEFQTSYNFQSIFYLILYIILCLLCQFLFIKWLQRDLNTLRFIAYKSAYQDYFKFNQKMKFATANHAIHQLQLAFLRIIDNSAGKRNKNYICYKLENVQYPFRPYIKMKKLIKSLKIQNKQTEDFNDSTQEFPIQRILREWARTIKKQKKTVVLTIDPPLD